MYANCTFPAAVQYAGRRRQPGDHPDGQVGLDYIQIDDDAP